MGILQRYITIKKPILKSVFCFFMISFYAAFFVSAYISIGAFLPFTTSASTTISCKSFLSGASNIGCNKIFSKIERNPRAPVFLSTASFAIAC